MHKSTILVIDDEKSIIDILDVSLKKEGLSVLSALDGLEGFEIANQEKPDLILLDIMMPDIDGYEVLERLKEDENTADIPVIFLTARVENEDKVKGLEAGAVDYITKPFFIKEVLARIKIQLKLKEYEEELKKKNAELEEFSLLLLDLNAKLEEISLKDELMQIWNRRAFQEEIDKLHTYCNRYYHTYSILIADLDRFKLYNDNYGHQAGDDVLKKVAQAIVNTARVTDFVARYGGEEIVILLPESDKETSTKTAERIISAVTDLAIVHEYNNGLGVVSISLGVASFNPEFDSHSDWEEILKRADDALYQAKDAGRNRYYYK